jgi:hypothetical protein
MFSENSQYDWLMKTLENSLNFDKSDPAKFRLHVLGVNGNFALVF